MSRTRNVSSVLTASENFALFNINSTIFSMFYKSCIQSVLTFSFICWFGNVSQKDKIKMEWVVNISSKITGFKQSSLAALYEKQVLCKANK